MVFKSLDNENYKKEFTSLYPINLDKRICLKFSTKHETRTVIENNLEVVRNVQLFSRRQAKEVLNGKSLMTFLHQMKRFLDLICVLE